MSTAECVRAKRAVWNKQMSERCEQTSEWTSEWPGTHVPIFGCSEPLCFGALLPLHYHPYTTIPALAPPLLSVLQLVGLKRTAIQFQSVFLSTSAFHHNFAFVRKKNQKGNPCCAVSFAKNRLIIQLGVVVFNYITFGSNLF